MVKHFFKLAVVVICLFSINSSAFAGSMDDLLIKGIRDNNIAVVKTAIANDADVNYESRGDTPLLAAIRNENIYIVDLLLKNGANPNQVVDIIGLKKEVPLNNAIWKAGFKKSSNRMVYLLVEAGADVNIVNQAGISPLMIAVANPPNIEIIQCLIARNADVKHVDNCGITPLMIAARYENGWGSLDTKTPKLAAAKILIKAGADPSITDNNGKTALNFAIDSNFNEMIDLLLPISPKMIR